MNRSRRKTRPVQAAASACIEPLEVRVLLSRLVGLDVSQYQGNISQTNWNTIASSKQFAIIRASTGYNGGYHDTQFTNNATRALAAGMDLGFYHYAYYDQSGSTPTAEADYFWNTIKNYISADGKHLMPVLDVEENGDPANGQSLSAWVNSWCERVISDAAADGLTVHPMIYCNLSDALRLDGSGASYTPAKYYPLWVANWISPTDVQVDQPNMSIGSSQIPWQHALNPTFLYSCWSFWQYTSTGSVSGISGNVDLDVFQGDDSAIQDYVIGSAQWSVGTRVQVSRTDANVNVFNNSDGTTIGTQPYGAKGTVIGDPEYGKSFIRYQVNFDTGVDGWVGAYRSVDPSGSPTIDWLTTVVPGVAANPNPADSSSPASSLPANFTWTAAPDATSYRVSLDSTFMAAVSTPSYTHGSIADGTHTWRIDSVNGDLTTTGTTWTFVLQSPPSAPTTPALSSLSDSGVVGDNITNVITPLIYGTAQPNSTVNLYRGGTILIGTDTASFIGQWSVTLATALDDGTYSITATATDSLGNTSVPSAPLSLTIDATAPGAGYGGQIPARGDSTLSFTIVYTDGGSGMNVSSFNSSDITVTGPNGYSANATFLSVDVGINGSPRTATYQIPAPGGTWTLDDNGSYSVQQNANQVQDVAGNSAPAGTIDSFVAAIPFAYLTGSTLNLDFDGSSNPITLGVSGANISATQNASTYYFASASVANIVGNGTSSDDHLAIDDAISQPIAFNGGDGNDTLDVNAGTVTFNSDLSATTTNLTINVNSDGAVIFSSQEHLAALNIAGASAALTADGNHTLYVSDLSFDSTAALDLNDNDLVVNSGDFSTIQNLVFSGYTATSPTGIYSTTGHATLAGGYPTTILKLVDNAVYATTLNSGSPIADWPLGSGNTISSNAIIGKYTYLGDTNLDGVVSGTDYLSIDSFYGQTDIPGLGALMGDTNFDGVVSGTDYLTIDSQFGLGLGNPLAAGGASSTMSPVSDPQSLVQSPASPAAIGLTSPFNLASVIGSSGENDDGTTAALLY